MPASYMPKINFWWWKRPSTVNRWRVQPAGHWRQDETLAQAAARELWEETGITAQPRYLSVCISGLRRIRPVHQLFISLSESDRICATEPHDNDIDCCRWVNADEILERAEFTFSAGG
ncbi:NUDIX domain-containing protein [Salmonella enterica subsp. enterica]|nr:NUDIX domain-containing protein [Salmonella enterica subsp. enterica]